MKFLEFDNTRDFPYYNNNPRISKSGWIVLLFLVPISLIVYFFFGNFSEILGSILFCLTLLIPLLYYSKWDYSLIFHKPTKNEIILAIIMFASYMVYAIVVGGILDMLNLSGAGIAESIDITWEMILGLIFSMMAEELVKFIPLMFFMRLFYKFTSMKKLSIVLSTTIVLIGFGLIHYDPSTTTIISVLILQGLGSIFEVYGYLKTKNLFVPYISHLLTDALIFILVMFGF